MWLRHCPSLEACCLLIETSSQRDVNMYTKVFSTFFFLFISRGVYITQIYSPYGAVKWILANKHKIFNITKVFIWTMLLSSDFHLSGNLMFDFYINDSEQTVSKSSISPSVFWLHWWREFILNCAVEYTLLGSSESC